MISIITPVYKAEDFIERCAVSLFEQNYADIEYIFVDDCTPDASIERLQRVIERYPSRQPQVKIVRHSVNRGVAAARNSGLDAATGEYIYYVDADDWLEKDAIGQMCDKAKQTGADIVACGWYLTFSKNERRMPMPSYADAETALRGMLSGQMRWNLWLYMIKHELYTRHVIRYVEGESVGEDMLVLVKLFSRAQSIAFVDKALYHYTKQNDNSITQMKPSQQMARLMPNLNAVVKYITENFGNRYEKEINFFKLNAKMPLLITDDEESYKVWTDCFPEANKYIMQNTMQTYRMRLVQQMAAKGRFGLVKLYYRLIFKFVYGILYR